MPKLSFQYPSFALKTKSIEYIQRFLWDVPNNTFFFCGNFLGKPGICHKTLTNC